MKKKQDSLKIEWLIPKSILVPLIIIGFLFPCVGIMWFLTQMDLPFFHAGDKWVVVILALLWWVSVSIIIWGWRIKREKIDES